ncbi:aromatic motif membrane protein [Mycoplasma sp. AC1221]
MKKWVRKIISLGLFIMPVLAAISCSKPQQNEVSFLVNNSVNAENDNWDNFIKNDYIQEILHKLYDNNEDIQKYIKKQKSINAQEYLTSLKTWLRYSNNFISSYDKGSFDYKTFKTKRNFTTEKAEDEKRVLFEENWLFLLFNFDKFKFMQSPNIATDEFVKADVVDDAETKQKIYKDYFIADNNEIIDFVVQRYNFYEIEEPLEREIPKEKKEIVDDKQENKEIVEKPKEENYIEPKKDEKTQNQSLLEKLKNSFNEPKTQKTDDDDDKEKDEQNENQKDNNQLEEEEKKQKEEELKKSEDSKKIQESDEKDEDMEGENSKASDVDEDDDECEDEGELKCNDLSKIPPSFFPKKKLFSIANDVKVSIKKPTYHYEERIFMLTKQGYILSFEIETTEKGGKKTITRKKLSEYIYTYPKLLLSKQKLEDFDLKKYVNSTRIWADPNVSPSPATKVIFEEEYGGREMRYTLINTVK